MLDLRLATSNDATGISRMSAALIEQGLPKAWSSARVLHHIRRKDSVVLVAKRDEFLLGFAVMEFAEYSAHLDLLAVSTLTRRRGIARTMLEWLHETAIAAGIFTIDLELRVSNGVALNFYTSMGYQQHDYRQRYYWHTEDAICMSRNLAVSSAQQFRFTLPEKFLVQWI
jgi:[ribosomal protein S18]-alanine N-acetyltransferase